MKPYAVSSLPRPLLVVVLLLGSTAAFASTNSASTSGPSPSAYIEQPQSTVTTVTTFSTPGSYYSSDSSYWGSSYSPRFHNDSYVSTYTFRPRRYFFPPNPPALGDPFVKSRTKSSSHVRSQIPLSLSDYVNEPFYGPLSPFLYEESLSKKRRAMIDDYLGAKNELVTELRAKLSEVRLLDAATRASRLAEFAQQQTPRIVAVENQAYAIRDELAHFRLFSDSSDWNEGREWRLGDDTRWESTLDDAKVMRGAAYFQDGLLPAQRRLLREYAMELDDSGRGPGLDIGLTSAGPYLYFSPETSRIRLPAKISDDLQQKIATYTQKKAAIKKEIRDVLYKEDRRWLSATRNAAVRELAARQAAAIAELDPLAEEIRRGLEPLPNPAKPAAISTNMPSAIADRINKYLDQKSAYQSLLNQKIVELKRRFPTSRIEFVKMGQGYGIQVVPYRKLKDEDLAKANETVSQLEGFNAEQIRTYVELVKEKLAIRDTLIQSAGSIAPLMTPRIVDLILQEYTSTIAVQELWRQYQDYEAAVLQPGLSPEQRRILFDAALVKLDQQLPAYTY